MSTKSFWEYVHDVYVGERGKISKGEPGNTFEQVMQHAVYVFHDIPDDTDLVKSYDITTDEIEMIATLQSHDAVLEHFCGTSTYRFLTITNYQLAPADVAESLITKGLVQLVKNTDNQMINLVYELSFKAQMVLKTLTNFT